MIVGGLKKPNTEDTEEAPRTLRKINASLCGLCDRASVTSVFKPFGFQIFRIRPLVGG
jgi:hypothetical protein